MNSCKLFKSVYSAILFKIFSVTAIMGVIANSRKTNLSSQAHPAAAYVLIWAAIIWFTMVDGEQASLFGFLPMNKELYKDSLLKAYKCASITNKGDSLDRHLIGRQFMVVLLVFCVSYSRRPIGRDELCGFPGWVKGIFFETGFTMILFTIMVGQLNSRANAPLRLLDYINNYFALVTLWISMVIEFSRLLNSVQILVSALAGKKVLESDEEPCKIAENVFFYLRCMISLAILVFFFIAVTITLWDGVLLIIITYVVLPRRLRELSCVSMTSKDAKKPPSIVEGVHHRLLDVQLCAPSSSGGATIHESAYMILNQWPIYLIHLLRLVVCILPLSVSQMILTKLRYGCYGKVNEQASVDLILNIPCLYMMCRAVSKTDLLLKDFSDLDSDEKIWLFEVPKNLPGDAFEGSVVLNDLHVIFLQKQRRIIHATHQGGSIDLKSTSNMIFSIIVSSTNNWSHFKSHIMAEISAQQIIDNNVKELEPSARFVHGLHSGLLNSALSPAVDSSPLFAISTTRECFEKRFPVPLPHYLDKEKKALPGFKFFFAARRSIATHLKSHGLDISVEPLFQNMVVHSIDHYLFYQFMRQIHFSLDGSETFMSYIRALVFIEFWTCPKINPFDNVRLCAVARSHDSHPFYLDVYRDLLRADPVLADQVITSTCF